MTEKPYWFGKGCPHFRGLWEIADRDFPNYEDTCTPELVFCAHPSNPSDVEGNCNTKQCPLSKELQKKLYYNTIYGGRRITSAEELEALCEKTSNA